jgi:hypothetical protein
MSRRVTLPGADELFRATGQGVREDAHGPATVPTTGVGGDGGVDGNGGDGQSTARSRTAPVRARPSGGPRRPTGRERHDEKITVYVSPGELVDLEHARLSLRADHGLAVDRGRIVREALALVIADLEAKGADSILVRRLRDG